MILFYAPGRNASAQPLTIHQDWTSFFGAGHLPWDLYLLAMSYQRTGEAAKARGCFERAACLLEETDFGTEQAAELNCIRAEAERTLGPESSACPTPIRAGPWIVPVRVPRHFVDH